MFEQGGEQQAAQQERLRQRYLRQLGLTPWVARQPLHAATLTALPLPVRPSSPHPAEAHTPAQMSADQAGRSAAPSATAHSPQSETNSQKTTAPAGESFAARALGLDAQANTAQTSAARRNDDQLSTTQPATDDPAAPKHAGSQDGDSHTVTGQQSASESLIFTLQTYAGERIHVWVEQQRADAPSLSREEDQLLHALLRALGEANASAPRRMTCAPTAGQVQGADDARQMLTTFARGLLGREQGARVLLCISDATATALFQAPRFQPQTLAGVHFLPVSALTEMLADPVNEKRATWQAMLAHDFR